MNMLRSVIKCPCLRHVPFPYERLSNVAHMLLDMPYKLLSLSVDCTAITLLIVICDLVMTVVVIVMKVAMRIVSTQEVEHVSGHVRHGLRHHVADDFYRRTSSTSTVQVRPHACTLLSLSNSYCAMYATRQQ